MLKETREKIEGKKDWKGEIRNLKI